MDKSDNPIVHVDEETKNLIRDFISEAIDSLDKNEPLIETLSVENNQENINAIFRVFHTIKGLSGFFNLTVISEFTHEAETLLDIFRKNKQPINDENLEIVYNCFDTMRSMIAMVEQNFTDNNCRELAKQMSVSLIEKIKEYGEIKDEIQKEIVPLKVETIEKKQTEPAPANEWIEKFNSEANDLILKAEKNLLELEKDISRKDLISDTFGCVHSLKGNSGFMGLKKVESISMQMETILDDLRNNRIEAGVEFITYLLTQLDEIRKEIKSFDFETINLDNIFNDNEDEAETKAEEKPAEIKTVKKEDVINKEESPSEKKSSVPLPSIPKQEVHAAPVIQKKDIRVDTAKLDKLFDLVGELITIETMVTNNPDLVDLDLPNFNRAANQMRKITRELQEITMLIRMTPLEGLFNKMKRLVRDLSLKFNKKINFEISGQETEMDKNVIEEISDPLVHILRNAIDHGIESAEIRKKKGKNEEGDIRLMARYEGNEILIIIEDDGAGLNREKILTKAMSRGLVSVSPEKIPDKEVFSFIFEPGFSTAEKVTEISGRGVGMDVVKKNIDKIRGTVNVDSIPEKGSRFTLRIPLTLSIMDGMLAKVGDTRYSIPILSIRESIRPRPEDITMTMDGLEVVKVRNEIFPVLRLHEIYNKQTGIIKLDEGILIIVESRDKKVCIFVDEILGQQQTVVKPLSEYIGKVHGITGCFILSNGEIGLIIDVDNLIKMCEK
jgi:two-component system, chemotaxis family, sensor kinase CheA